MPRRSARLANASKPNATLRADSVHQYTIPKKQTKQEKEVEKKREERAKRKGRGMRRADTFFEYEGHPETRERVDNPFNSLMGKTIEIYFGKDRSWRRARVKEKTVDAKKEEEEEEEEEEVDDDDEGLDASVGSGADATAAPTPTAVALTATSSSSTAASAPAKPRVEPGAHLSNVHVLQEGGVLYEANLSFINLAQNSDKYYVIQVAEADDKSAYYCVTHWGRTGTLGMFKVDAASKDDAIAAFKHKFLEKTGLEFEDRNKPPVPGHYKYKKKDYATLAAPGTVLWQYYVDDFVDGKATGWYPYTKHAAATVEGVYSEWRVNDWLDVRCVQSGYFQYRVDFNTMTQMNLRTSKCRKIRRVDASGVVTDTPSSTTSSTSS
ncbi:hypothetical protein PTSG_00749 [Salpingoeca rosetta]|uniref:NAD(+) ADP-ribosyltransferase n=1 Tax=Salpingoeca rosetta (strain ATCC 50818 / BSB-021) TaxID=946362 RepID=F2TXD1_SALR5|nr:uncharacterized protein PTSG_00749 [Salpingoeca rosetta]EGD76040.1 hypothetical protein PTSG_00749 [Salpingoeca rosetta]|eukprot:XP_004998215.1 hypothetical protein PTSG_00749 [Salpingoeca rosetta]